MLMLVLKLNLKLSFKGKFKRALSDLKQISANKIVLKTMNNTFYLTLKALFVLKIFKFLL